MDLLIFIRTCYVIIFFRSNVTAEYCLNEFSRLQNQDVSNLSRTQYQNNMTEVFTIHGQSLTEFSKGINDQCMTDFSGTCEQNETDLIKTSYEITHFKDYETSVFDCLVELEEFRLSVQQGSQQLIKMSYLNDFFLWNKLKTDRNVCVITVLQQVFHIRLIKVRHSAFTLYTGLFQQTTTRTTYLNSCRTVVNKTKLHHLHIQEFAETSTLVSLTDITRSWFQDIRPQMFSHQLKGDIDLNRIRPRTIEWPIRYVCRVYSSSSKTLSNRYSRRIVIFEAFYNTTASINSFNDTLHFKEEELARFARCGNVSIKSIILLSTVIPAVVFTMLAISTYVLIKYRRRKIYVQNKKERMFRIRENARDAKYPVFISYSSEDYDFLMEYVYDPLKQNLHHKTEIERDLVCLGDRDFRLGKPVTDEIIRCLEESAVCLILLSHNYCRSKYSMMEFEYALTMDKQIILMVKDEVNENEMKPSLRHFFRNNTRVLWKRRGDQYQLTTTWNNICTSILEVAPTMEDPNIV